MTRPSPHHDFAALLDRHAGHAVQTAKSTASPADYGTQPPAPAPPPHNLIPLGTIGHETPSVSHLLTNHPDLHDDCWQIIHAKANHHKPFTTMRHGTAVFLDPTSRELLWSTDQPRVTAGINKPQAVPPPTRALPGPPHDEGAPVLPADSAPAAQPETGVRGGLAMTQKDFSQQLAASVKAYLGHPYHEIDCYSLVVRGLQDQGVQYNGPDGLRQRLTRLASDQGLPANAFMNGEGLISVAGTSVYDQSFTRVTDAERQTAAVMTQLEPLLQEGMLLSFSTPTRGHTGVIAQRNGQWTYINSGVIDHQVNGGKVSRRVGEETLAAEIKNWLLLAKDKRTSLQVSAGLFDIEKLRGTGSLMADRQGGRPGKGNG